MMLKNFQVKSQIVVSTALTFELLTTYLMFKHRNLEYPYLLYRHTIHI